MILSEKSATFRDHALNDTHQERTLRMLDLHVGAVDAADQVQYRAGDAPWIDAARDTPQAADRHEYKRERQQHQPNQPQRRIQMKTPMRRGNDLDHEPARYHGIAS